MIQLNGNITLVVGQSYELTANNLELTLPYSEIKQSIEITLGEGVNTYKLKFTDLGEGYKVQGLINGLSIKAGNDVTMNNAISLKSYKRGTVTYWSVEVITNPIVIENNNLVDPQIALLAVDPNNINTTDDIPEGVVNLYYLDSRARDSISATAPIDYDNATGVISTTLTQYTDADVGALFTNGVHTGISFTFQANKINATVSLNTFGLDALSDVQLGQLGLQTGQVLKYSANKWINTKLLSTELSDSDLLMRRADNLNNLGNVATARNNLGLGSAALLDANNVITTSSNIGDLGNVMLANLANGHTLKYNSAVDKWLNAKLGVGDIDGLVGVYAPINSPTFTGLPLAPTPANNSNSTQIATTAWVKARIDEGGGGGGGGGATSLDQLTDVSINDLAQVVGQTLRFNGAEYVNAKLASTDLSNSANIVLVNTAPTFITQGQGDNSTKVATTAYVDTAIAGVGSDTIDAIITSVGLNANGTLPNYTSNNHLINGNSHHTSLSVLDNAIATKLNSATYTAADILAKLLGVDGAGSGLDADLLDGSHKVDFLLKADNLAGLTNLALARANLGLGSIATYNVGANEGEVPVWGPDGELTGQVNFDNGLIIENADVFLDNGFIV